MRICSFLPSATEMLFAIGAGEQVCGVTFECDYPQAALGVPKVVFSHLPPGLGPAEIDAIVSAEGAQGRSLYFVDMPRLEALAPDLVILQDLCRVCALDSPTLAREMAHLPSQPRVLSLSAHSLAGVLAEIEVVGEATGFVAGAGTLTQSLRTRLAKIGAGAAERLAAGVSRPRVLALEWLDPLFQGGHWIPEMIELAGGSPVLATAGEKSVRITWEQVREADPEIIVVMPCGYHLAETIAQFREVTLPVWWPELAAVRRDAVYAVDGTAYFSRPGPRLVDGAEIMAAIVAGEGFEALPVGSLERLSTLC
jgi:iron complex transport system substrate-binding protein